MVCPNDAGMSLFIMRNTRKAPMSFFKTNSTRKAQMSLFILLGVIVLLLIGIVYIMSGGSKPKGGSAGADQLQPVKDLVTGCMQKVTGDGITKLIRQGGFIFGSQGGPEPDPNPTPPNNQILFVDYSNYRVFIPISPTYFFPPTIPAYSAIIPIYPSEFFPYLDAAHNTPASYSGPFASVGLRPLSEGQSPWAYQLGVYLDRKLLDCVNPLTIPDVFPSLSITTGLPPSTVTIAPEQVYVDTTFPITVTVAATGEQTQLEQFSASLTARLGRLHEFVRNRLETEARDFSYDINDTLNDANPFKINVYYGVAGGADVIEFEDNANFIAGQKVLFWAARLNRRPAISHIGPITLPPGVTTLQASDINPVGYDLDEDSLTFSYEPSLPLTVSGPGQTIIRVYVSDGEFHDYQDVLVITS